MPEKHIKTKIVKTLILNSLFLISVIFTNTISATKIWDGTGADNLASNPANWVGDAPIVSEDSVIFGSTNPTKFCDWDLSLNSVAIGTFTIESGYLSNVNINTNIIIRANLTVSGGNFNVLAGSVTLTGDMTYNGGQFTANTSTIGFYGGFSNQTISLLNGTTFWNIITKNKLNKITYCQNTEIFINGNIFLGGWIGGQGGAGFFDTTGSTVHIRGGMDSDYGALDTNTTNSKWIIDGTNNQSINSALDKVYDLEINKVNGTTVTFTSPITVNNNLTIKNGILKYDNAANISVNGNITVVPPGMFNHSNGVLYLSGSKNTVIDIPTSQPISSLYINKSTQGWSVSLVNDLEMKSSLTIAPGIFDISNKKLTVTGIDKGVTSTFIVDGSTVVLVDNGNNNLQTSPFIFDVLRVSRTNGPANLLTISQPVKVNKFFQFDSGGRISFSGVGKFTVMDKSDISGYFDVGTATFTAMGSVNLNSGGILNFDNEYTAGKGQVYIGNSLTVNPGAAIRSDSNSELLKSTSTGTYFSFVVNGGSVNINGLTIDSLNNQGLTINSGSYIRALSTVSFVNCAPDATALKILQSGTSQYVFGKISFDNSVSTNVFAPNLVNPGYILMRNSAGIKSGPDYENDPNSCIFWSTPIAPAGFTGVAKTTWSIEWNWIDNSNDEQGYRLKNSTGGIVADLSAGTTKYIEIGLSINTSYYRFAEGYNPIGFSTPSNAIKYTLANPPLYGITWNYVGTSSIAFSWNQNGNPSETIYEVTMSTDNFVNNFSTPVAFSAGLKSNTTTFINLLSETSYYFRGRAQNGDAIATDFSATVSTKTLSSQILSVNVNPATMNFGIVQIGGFIVALTSITITNDGNGNETFQLKTTTWTTPSNFQMVTSSPTTNTQFRILGQFNESSVPNYLSFDTANDVITGNNVTASATAFAGIGSGMNVPASSTTGLWLRLDTPTGSPVATQQTFYVTITAVAP